jgi:hypothetical protein
MLNGLFDIKFTQGEGEFSIALGDGWTIIGVLFILWMIFG